jgi:hypothetical protein
VEMRYNRAVCAPMINTDNKVVALDNVLVLWFYFMSIYNRQSLLSSNE